MDLTALNEFQTPITDELLSKYPREVVGDFYDYINQVPFIQHLISADRPRAKDLLRDDQGRIIVDLCRPHINENMDYFRESAIHFQKHGTYTKMKVDMRNQSPYQKWFRREMWRSWYGMVRESDGEWVTGPLYYYLNYFPIIQTVMKEGSKTGFRTVDFPQFWEGVYWRFHYWHQARYGGMYNDFLGGEHAAEIASRGKAFAYSQDVETPDGYKYWRDIQIGDKLFAPDGTTTIVIDIPFDEESDVYKMEMTDGRIVYTTLEHLWKINFNSIKRQKLYTTKELMNSDKLNRHAIEKHQLVEYPSQLVPLDPYFLGILLGDGSITCSIYNTAQITGLEEDINHYALKTGLEFKLVSNTKHYYIISYPDIEKILKEMMLHRATSDLRFIPDCYKYNTSEVRRKILSALLDTDGSVHDCGKAEFYTSSEVLANDVAFIVRSLGYNCNITSKQGKYKKNGITIVCKMCYIVYIQTTDQLFTLPRKANLFNERINKIRNLNPKLLTSKCDKTSIKSITYSHRERCKCVTVDREDGMFLIGSFLPTHNSKSYSGASLMCRNMVLGTSMNHRSKVKTSVVADMSEYLDKDGILNKFEDGYRFIQEHTEFPSRFIKESWSDYNWTMGYKESSGQTKGSKNVVLGVLCNGDPDKLRGKRVDTQVYEEFGSFSKFITTYQTGQPNVSEGEVAFGQSIAFGTGGTEGNNFAGALEFINHPKGYRVYALPNYYDEGSNGKTFTLFYYPAYVNAKGYYNSDGVSDVTGALLSELMERYTLKYNSSDPRMLSQRKAEYSFTLKEAIMTTYGTLYNVAALNERVNYLDMNPEVTADMLVGKMKLEGGEVKFDPSANVKAITQFPHKDNKMHGAVVISQLPQKDSNGRIVSGRYIAGADVFDDDESETLSLVSEFILDLFTDEIVAEYTGRLDFADDTYEQLRLLTMFYNAELNYENNKKGLFAYFSRFNSLYLLSDTLEFLKDKDWAKEGRGNKGKGVMATGPVKNYAKRIIRDYLNAPVEVEIPDPDNASETIITTVPRLSTIKFRALLQELAMHNDDGNFDRHDALAMLMLLREDKLRLYNGKVSEQDYQEEQDDFFIKHYDRMGNNKGVSMNAQGIISLNSKTPSYLSLEEQYNMLMSER